MPQPLLCCSGNQQHFFYASGISHRNLCVTITWPQVPLIWRSLGPLSLLVPVGISNCVTPRPASALESFHPPFWRSLPSHRHTPHTPPLTDSKVSPIPLKPSTSSSSSWIKYSVSTTIPSTQTVKTSDLLYTDRRKWQNIISCSSDSCICLVQGDLKYHTIHLHCINSYTEGNISNTLFLGFTLTNSHQLIPRNIWIYASSAADSTMLALLWMEQLTERSGELSLVLDKRPLSSIIQYLY